MIPQPGRPHYARTLEIYWVIVNSGRSHLTYQAANNLIERVTGTGASRRTIARVFALINVGWQPQQENKENENEAA